MAGFTTLHVTPQNLAFMFALSALLVNTLDCAPVQLQSTTAEEHIRLVSHQPSMTTSYTTTAEHIGLVHAGLDIAVAVCEVLVLDNAQARAPYEN